MDKNNLKFEKIDKRSKEILKECNDMSKSKYLVPLYRIYLLNWINYILINKKGRKITFITLRGKNNEDLKLKNNITKNWLLVVKEHGKEKNNVYFHILKYENTHCFNNKFIIKEEKEIKTKEDLSIILDYMQKEQKGIKWWWVKKKIDKKIKTSSRLTVGKMVENKLKERYKISDYRNYEKNNVQNILSSEKKDYLILEWILKTTNKIKNSFLSEYLLLLNQKKNNKKEVTNLKLKFLSDKKLLKKQKTIIWLSLNIVLYKGIKKKSIQEIIELIGKDILFVVLKKEKKKLKLENQLSYYIGIEIWIILEKVMKEVLNIDMLKLIGENKKWALLENKDTSLFSPTELTTEFKDHLKISNEVNYNKSLFLKPLKVLLNKKNKVKEIGTRFNRKLSFKKWDYRLKINKRSSKILDYRQGHKWYIKNNLFEYIFKNALMLIKIELKNKTYHKKFKRPDYKTLGKNHISKIYEWIKRNKLKTEDKNFLSMTIYEIVEEYAKLKSWNKKEEECKNKILYDNMKRVLPKDTIGLTDLVDQLKDMIDDIKKINLDYKHWLEKIRSNKSYDDILEKKLRLLDQIFIWKKYFTDFNGIEAIYFLWLLDKRGRSYQEGDLTPLSDKWFRHLLTMSPRYYYKDCEEELFIYTSKCYFGSNKSIKEYLNLFNENIEKWCLLEEETLWKADELIAFISCILEYKNYKKNKDYKTNILIELDATSNVYQIISLMSLDTDLGLDVNVLESGSEKPKDLYTEISNTISRKLGFKMERKMVKKSIMCYAYGLTKHGSIKYLREANENEYLSNDDILKIAKEIEKILKSKYKGVWYIRTLLEELVKLKYNNNELLEDKYITVKNDYISYNNIMYKRNKETLVYTKREGKLQTKKRIYLLEELKELDLDKMKTSVTANVIHSIDAECLFDFLWNHICQYDLYALNKELKTNKAKYKNYNKKHFKIIKNLYKYGKVFTIHDCLMFPAKITKFIREEFPKTLQTLNLDNRIEKLYKENGIHETDQLKKFKEFKKNSNFNEYKASKNFLT